MCNKVMLSSQVKNQVRVVMHVIHVIYVILTLSEQFGGGGGGGKNIPFAKLTKCLMEATCIIFLRGKIFAVIPQICPHLVCLQL